MTLDKVWKQSVAIYSHFADVMENKCSTQSTHFSNQQAPFALCTKKSVRMSPSTFFIPQRNLLENYNKK